MISSFSLVQIESNEIFATIDHSNGMVSFHVNPEKYNGPSMADHIDEEVSKSRMKTLAISLCTDEEMYGDRKEVVIV